MSVRSSTHAPQRSSQTLDEVLTVAAAVTAQQQQQQQHWPIQGGLTVMTDLEYDLFDSGGMRLARALAEVLSTALGR
jgi:hypothetical protein